MREELLHYIWKTKSFSQQQLITTTGQNVSIFDVGSHNDNAGPDFLEAKLKIGEVLWAGHVEIHINSSDWIQHNHHNDSKYNGVILHVVWKDNQPITYPDGEKIYTLELKNIVDSRLLLKYDQLSKQNRELLCETSTDNIDPFIISNQIQKAAVERLYQKSEEVNDLYKASNKDWEETAYRLCAQTFGLKVNKFPFYELSLSLPYKILKKNSFSRNQLMALVFGTAGFLDEKPVDDYQAKLKNQYTYMKQKYDLGQKLVSHNWNFSRLRPYSFPTVRLARFALFLLEIDSLSQYFLTIENLDLLSKNLNQNSDEYWSSHYHFGKTSERDFFRIGSTFLRTFVINAIIPFKIAFSNSNELESGMEKAIEWLDKLPPENNKITRQFKVAGFINRSSADSQGIIHQYKEYCLKKKCLNCGIGAAILK